MALSDKLREKLGVKKNIPKVDFRQYSGIISGLPKIGKTSTAAKLPNTILLAFESGYDAQVVDYVDCVGDWKKFIDLLDELEDNIEEIREDIRILVIDTAAEAYKACEAYMLKKESAKDRKIYKEIGDIPHGKGYLALDKYFTEQIQRIYKLGLRPLYITHIDLKTVRPKDKNIEPYEITVTRLPDRLRKIIEPEVSYILHMDRATVDGKALRVLRMKNTETMSTNGSRVRLKGDIFFDTEEEAVAKFGQEWESAVMEKLTEAGINKSMEDIKNEQDKELTDKVAEYKASINKDEILEKIKTAISSGKSEVVTAIKEVMSMYDIKSLKDPSVISIQAFEQFKVLLEA